MTLADIIQKLELVPLTQPQAYDQLRPTAGYASDLLSCVMANAPREGVWVTLQAHANIVAVAALLDLCAVLITEGAMPDSATIEKANEEGIILLSTDRSTFFVVGKLWELGLRAP